METFGRIALVLAGTTALLVGPAAELARGMATNPGSHPFNYRAWAWSTAGAAAIIAGVIA